MTFRTEAKCQILTSSQSVHVGVLPVHEEADQLQRPVRDAADPELGKVDAGSRRTRPHHRSGVNLIILCHGSIG